MRALGRVGAQPTISSDAATAWQELSARPRQTDPVAKNKLCVGPTAFDLQRLFRQRRHLKMPLLWQDRRSASLSEPVVTTAKSRHMEHFSRPGDEGLYRPGQRPAARHPTRPGASCPDTGRSAFGLAPCLHRHFKSIATRAPPAAEILEPPMALAGPKHQNPMARFRLSRSHSKKRKGVTTSIGRRAPSTGVRSFGGLDQLGRSRCRQASLKRGFEFQVLPASNNAACTRWGSAGTLRMVTPVA